MSIEQRMHIEPAGRPHMRCLKCRMTVVWPTDLSDHLASEFATIVRQDSVAGMHFAESRLGLGTREAKVLVLHITPNSGLCHKCERPVSEGESICACRSVNINW